jgi:hypothetical protein
MKRHILFCLFVAMFASIANAETPSLPASGSGYSAIPGGIVYSDCKDAIYFDFATGKETNLTCDLDGAVVKPPIAASITGEQLAWRQDSKFWVRQLRKGMPFVIKYQKEKPRKLADGTVEKNDFIWQSDAVADMHLSPDGKRFSFEAACHRMGWVLKSSLNWKQSHMTLEQIIETRGHVNATPADMNTFTYPQYVFVNDPFFGIYYLSTVGNGSNTNNQASNFYGEEIYEPAFGNVIDNPDVNYFAFKEDWERNLKLRGGNNPFGSLSGGGSISGLGRSQYLYNDLAIKKSARFLCFASPESWKNGKKLAYFIFNIGNQWGPIEIRLLDNDIRSTCHTISDGGCGYDKFKAWEVFVAFPSCAGLAVRPDGSISILGSNGSLLLLDGADMEKGMLEAEIKVEKTGKGLKVVNIPSTQFYGKPRQIAQGVMARWLQWVSNEEYLCLGPDNLVYSQKLGGGAKKVHDAIQSNFCYVVKAPPDTPAIEVQVIQAEKFGQQVPAIQVSNSEQLAQPAPIAHNAKASHKPVRKVSVVKPSVAKGGIIGEKKIKSDGELKSRWSQLFQARENVRFSVGSMGRFVWGRLTDNSAVLHIPENEPLAGFMQSAWVPDKSIEQIDDPAQYFKDQPFPTRNIDKEKTGATESGCFPGGTKLVRYSKLMGKYFGVELIKVSPDSTVYKKRAWPDNSPELIKVTLKE